MKYLLSIILIFSVLLIGGVYTQADVYGSSLINYWPSNDGSGSSVKDYGSSPQNLTLNGTASFTKGKIGSGSLKFSGVSGNGANFSGVTSGTTFTIAMWVYSKVCTAYCNGLTQAGTQGLYFYGPTHKLDFYYSGDHFSSTSFVDNQWMHIAIVVNSGTGSFYINGKLDSNTFGSVPSAGLNSIGCDSGTGAECMNGNYDDIRIYNRALSKGEVQTLYYQGFYNHVTPF